MNFPASLPINYNNTAYFYPDDTGVLGSFYKLPMANTLVSLDYTSLVSDQTATIVSISFLLDYGTAPQLIISGTTIQGNNTVVSFIVSGGMNGVKYTLQVNALLSNNTTLSHALEVVVAGPGVKASDCCDVRTLPGAPNFPISDVFQQAQILNGDGTRFGSSFIVYWVGANAPTTANILDRWYNTGDGLVYDRITDGYSVFWVAVAQRPQQYVASPTAPVSPNPGDMWYNLSSQQLMIWIDTGAGGVWAVVSGLGGGGGGGGGGGTGGGGGDVGVDTGNSVNVITGHVIPEGWWLVGETGATASTTVMVYYPPGVTPPSNPGAGNWGTGYYQFGSGLIYSDGTSLFAYTGITCTPLTLTGGGTAVTPPAQIIYADNLSVVGNATAINPLAVGTIDLGTF